jgi:FKBP-type peptidyl-prolyl cis-trans isomerase
VVVDYTAFLNNGTVWDSTEIKGRKQLSFRMGLKQTIPGLESVLEYMQPGGEATCVIPPQYAYGAKGVCLPNGGR